MCEWFGLPAIIQHDMQGVLTASNPAEALLLQQKGVDDLLSALGFVAACADMYGPDVWLLHGELEASELSNIVEAAQVC